MGKEGVGNFSGWILINSNALCVIKNVFGHPVHQICWAGAIGFRAGNLFCHLPYRAGGEKSKCRTLMDHTFLYIS